MVPKPTMRGSVPPVRKYSGLVNGVLYAALKIKTLYCPHCPFKAWGLTTGKTVEILRQRARRRLPQHAQHPRSPLGSPINTQVYHERQNDDEDWITLDIFTLYSSLIGFQAPDFVTH